MLFNAYSNWTFVGLVHENSTTNFCAVMKTQALGFFHYVDRIKKNRVAISHCHVNRLLLLVTNKSDHLNTILLAIFTF